MKKNLIIGLIVFVGVMLIVVSLFNMGSGFSGVKLGGSYQYDTDKIASIIDVEPDYTEGVGFGIDVENAKAIDIDDAGNIYVMSADKLVRYSADGEKQIEIGFDGRGLAFAVGFDGEMIVCLEGVVQIYSASCEEIGEFSFDTEGSLVTAVAVDIDSIYLADAGRRVIDRYSKSGELLKEISEIDTSKSFVIPSPYFDIKMAKDGLLRVVNPGRHRIEAYSKRGYMEFFWGDAATAVKGFCGCCNPSYIYISDDGNFITSEKGIARVKVYDEDGKYVGLVAGVKELTGKGVEALGQRAGDMAEGPYDIAANDVDRIYILDAGKKMVRVFVRADD